MVAMDQIVAEHQGTGVASDPFLADQKCLGDAVRARLLGIGDADAEMRAVMEQALELRQVLRRGDHQHLANAGQQQGRERVVHHRLVIDRQQLFRRRLRDRMQSCTRTAGQKNSFADHAEAPRRCP